MITDMKEYQRNYYLANREKLLAYRAEYYQENKELILANGMEYYLRNCDIKLAQYAARYQKNKEGIKLFYQTLEGKLLRLRIHHKERSGILDDVLDNLSIEDIQDVFKAQDNKCLGCMKPIDLMNFDSWEYDHIVPVFKGGHLNKDNFQALCIECHGHKQKKSIMFMSVAISI